MSSPIIISLKLMNLKFESANFLISAKNSGRNDYKI